MSDVFGWLFISVGVLFFISGSLALLRFPDVYTRLHALTKADNLGLGLIVLGLALHQDSLIVSVKLLLIWLLVMAASASGSHVIARAARASGYGVSGRDEPRRGETP
jgi:multicomponent Na+:H+ antiporter subunit G